MTAKDIVLAIVIPLAVAEVGPWCGWIAARMLPWAAKLRYGDTDRAAIRAEEWSGDLDEIPGQLTKLAYSLGQYLAGSVKFAQRKMGSKVSRALAPPDPREAELVTIGQIAAPEYLAEGYSPDSSERQRNREIDQVRRARDLSQARIIGAFEDCILPLSSHAAHLTGTPLKQVRADVAWGLASVAIGYRNLGLVAEALPLFEQALQLSETALAPEDKLLFIRRRNLANSYRELGLAGKAESLERQVGQIALTSGSTEQDAGPGAAHRPDLPNLSRTTVESGFGLA